MPEEPTEVVLEDSTPEPLDLAEQGEVDEPTVPVTPPLLPLIDEAGPDAAPDADAISPGPPSQPLRVGVALLLVAAVVGGLVGGGVVALAKRDDRVVGAGAAVAKAGTNLRLRGAALDVQGVLARAEPAVVSIETDGFVQQNGFFGSTVQRVRGAGTGMVLSADGVILTNNHVIEGAQKITVTFDGDKSPRPADLVGTDTVNDVAVIKIRDASGLPTVTLGSSAALRVGDDVVAIGNALALVGGHTVTRGIVSALERSIDDPQENLQHLIQTDAAINSGNSGGPLVNAAGEVVGMNTIVIRSSDSGAPVESIGFAISIDAIKPIVDRLRSGKPVVATAFVGIAAVNLTSDLAQQLGVPVTEGALVQEITPGSPAELARIRVGDVITNVGDTAIATSQELVDAVHRYKPDDKVAIAYYRGDQKRTTTITVGRRGGVT